ncbi:MAG: hypothetical protein JSR85_01345 [Proteobacteria bacterium]|nr:hypothetical protein [Pseudomonadota bacterium]
MVNFRAFLYTLLIICTPCLSLAAPTTITSVKSVEDTVSSLLSTGIKPRDILVVWDFHGVITIEKSQKSHLTLNKDIPEVLNYLQQAKVSNIIATAWDDFNAVARSVDSLGLALYFDVDLTEKPLEEVSLGRNGAVALQGYKNGRVVALKKLDDFTRYFRHKAFASEWCFPNRDFKHIIFVDDSPENTKLFEKDFKRTIYYDKKNKKKLIIYYFYPSQGKPAITTYQQPKRSSSASDGEL